MKLHPDTRYLPDWFHYKNDELNPDGFIYHNGKKTDIVWYGSISYGREHIRISPKKFNLKYIEEKYFQVCEYWKEKYSQIFEERRRIVGVTSITQKTNSFYGNHKNGQVYLKYEKDSICWNWLDKITNEMVFNQPLIDKFFELENKQRRIDKIKWMYYHVFMKLVCIELEEDYWQLRSSQYSYPPVQFIINGREYWFEPSGSGYEHTFKIAFEEIIRKVVP